MRHQRIPELPAYTDWRPTHGLARPESGSIEQRIYRVLALAPQQAWKPGVEAVNRANSARFCAVWQCPSAPRGAIERLCDGVAHPVDLRHVTETLAMHNRY